MTTEPLQRDDLEPDTDRINPDDLRSLMAIVEGPVRPEPDFELEEDE